MTDSIISFSKQSLHTSLKKDLGIRISKIYFLFKKFALSKKNLVMLEFLEISTLVPPLLSQDLYKLIRKYLVHFLHFVTVRDFNF